jgi:Flp pilus assembly pilin Flp
MTPFSRGPGATPRGQRPRVIGIVRELPAHFLFKMKTPSIPAIRHANPKLGGDIGLRRMMRRSLRRLLRETCGQDLTEFAMILAALALVAIAMVSPFAGQLSKVFNQAAECHAKARAEQAKACKDIGPRTPPRKS